jgi:hypothetical protein
MQKYIENIPFVEHDQLTTIKKLKTFFLIVLIMWPTIGGIYKNNAVAAWIN